MKESVCDKRNDSSNDVSRNASNPLTSSSADTACVKEREEKGPLSNLMQRETLLLTSEINSVLVIIFLLQQRSTEQDRHQDFQR